MSLIHLSESAAPLARMFARERELGNASAFSLPGGASLYEPGEPADHLYLLTSGRLGAFRSNEQGERQFLGIIRPGEPAGEMSLITRMDHSGQVVALRDSELLLMSKSRFFDIADEEGEVMADLARLMITRARQDSRPVESNAPNLIGIISVNPEVSARHLGESIIRHLAELGIRSTLIGSEASAAPTQWFTNVEQEFDLVIFVAEAGEHAWRSICGRQIDRMILLAAGDGVPPRTLTTPIGLKANLLLDLVLVHRSITAYPQHSQGWVDLTGAARLFHIRHDNTEDSARLARILGGKSVGLVLSGGGARAYAHIGAIKALKEAKVPIDFIGGVSMGAVVAAGLAMNWSVEELEKRIRAAFVDSSPLDDIAFPLIAMTRGLKVEERLREHFGDVQIADLWLPFFCLSSNLTTGASHIHRSGSLRNALRASISLPGILPPVFLGSNVLVDGAVMKNFPADLMRAMHLGPVIGIDVSRGRSLESLDVQAPRSLWSWLWSGAWRKGPPIVALLMRAATISTGRDLISSRDATDLLVMPQLEGIDIRDWEAYDQAVEQGYEAMQLALEKLTGPVTELRTRR